MRMPFLGVHFVSLGAQFQFYADGAAQGFIDINILSTPSAASPSRALRHQAANLAVCENLFYRRKYKPEC